MGKVEYKEEANLSRGCYGNMTSDGRFRYTWNAENRLVRAQELVAPTNRNPYTVTYAYDHKGRMVRKDVFCSGNSPFSILHYTFVWDGWNIIRETQWPVTSDQWSAGPLATNHYPLVTDYVWGLDLDGTLQGAGGVGGLLAVLRSDCAATNSAFCILHSALYLPTYDANGNVSEYIDERGEVVAHYDYSPFGETLIESGDLASSFPHRFSTKPWCPVTGLYEYQMRKYRPEIGRWLSRDPIGEKADLVNVNGFCGGILMVDCLGENNPSSFLDGVVSETEARKIVEELFPDNPARIAKEMKMWSKAHGTRRSSLMRITKKFLKKGSKGVGRAGSALLSAVILILTPLEVGAEPDCRLLLPPQDNLGDQTSWVFESAYNGVACETEETEEVEHFDDARTFWDEVSATVDKIQSEMVGE